MKFKLQEIDDYNSNLYKTLNPFGMQRHYYLKPYYERHFQKFADINENGIKDFSSLFYQPDITEINDKNPKINDKNPKSFPIGTAMASEPVAALELVAFDTRWDYDMSWVDMYTTSFPSYITPGEYPATRQYTVYSHLYFEEPVSNWGQPFKTRVQENLNKAVKYCAYAINYIADAWAEGDNPKSCEECSGDNNPYQEKSFSKGTRFLRYLSIVLILGITNAFFLPYLPIIERYLFAS